MGNNNQIENKATKLEEKYEEEKLNKNDKIFKYVYFIITYDKSNQLKVFLSKYKGSETLEKVNDKSYDSENGLFTSDIYRFKIIEEVFEKDKKEYQIPINVGNKHYQYIIKLKDLKRDFYEYNFEIKELDILLLDYQKQFEMYRYFKE